MKKLILFFLLGITTYSNAQNFDIADFNKKLEVAEWLSIYDKIAWWTSDSVMAQPKEQLARLGSEWFCFQEDDLWHAAYGKFENGNFDLVFHFTVKSRNEVKLTNEPIDTSLLNSYSRALKTAMAGLSDFQDKITVRCNQYIKRNDDGTISVWILPAFQTDGTAVYGGEFIFTIDKTGQHILSTNHYFKGDFYGLQAESSKEFYINYEELEKPTVGGIFFAWYYAPYFKKVVLINKNSRSMPFYLEDGWTWIHADDTGTGKSKKKSRKKKRRKN